MTDIIVQNATDNHKIIIVAPHGVMGDDDYTDQIASGIREYIGCAAVINTYYKKPEKTPVSIITDAPDIAETDVPEYIADLNHISGLEKVPAFMEAIKATVDKNLRNSDNNLQTIIMLHGCSDRSVDVEASRISYIENASAIHAIIGYGQGPDRSKLVPERTYRDKSDKPTMEEWKARGLADCLCKNELRTIIASRRGNFCARRATNTTQIIKDTLGVSVQVVQLEIRKLGWREEYSVDHTVKVIGDALNDFMNIRDL